ncbi:MAG TPA: heavy metal-binding domain-containing protein [Polyangiaceae bacterium]
MSNYQPPGGQPPYGGPPQQPGAPAQQYADLPQHARERLEGMKKTHFFTSDLSVNEFLLVKQAGFDPMGLVMGSSIYNISARPPQNLGQYEPGKELVEVTQALYHARELAMTRMEEEADELGADGIVGVRMDVNLHAWGQSVAEFIAVGTAVRHASGQSYRNSQGKPFQSGLSGQDFWTLLRSGYRPVGFVMGNCVYYVRPEALIVPNDARNGELSPYTHCLYDARELAMERLQAEAEDVSATGIVGVEIEEKQHTWGTQGGFVGGNAAKLYGETIEFFVFGTAVVPFETKEPPPRPTMVIPAND